MQAAKGAVAIIKNVLGVGLANSQTVNNRKNICNACDKLNRGVVNQCSICSCIIGEKVLRKDESCPLSKW